MSQTEWKVSPGSVIKDDKDNPFIIDATMWNAVNVYVYNGVKLPEDVKQTDIKGAYALIREHTKKWRDVTFPKTLTVADDIVDYGTKAPRLYKALEDAAIEIQKEKDGSPAYEAAKKRFLSILDRLISQAAGHATNAQEVKELITTFRGQTSDDHTEIKRLNEKYEEQYGEGSEKAKELAKQIKDTNDLISSLNDEYNHAVVVAATTPTYAWVWPFGTIAAGVVAGIYGDKAVKIKNLIADTNERLALLKTQEKARLELVTILELAVNSTGEIEELMGPAITGLDNIMGKWSAIASDLGKLKKHVEGMRGGFDLYFVDIPQAIDDWKTLAVRADAFRVNAFIQVTVVTDVRTLRIA